MMLAKAGAIFISQLPVAKLKLIQCGQILPLLDTAELSYKCSFIYLAWQALRVTGK